jgi:hypothetical protein
MTSRTVTPSQNSARASLLNGKGELDVHACRRSAGFLFWPLMHKTAPLFILLFCVVPWLRAADVASDAFVLAAQKDTEERVRRLSADVQTVLETQDFIRKRQDALQQRLDSLESEVRHLKDEFQRATSNFASRDEMREYAAKLRELDEKRARDKELILKHLQDLAKIPVTQPSGRSAPRRPATDSDEAPVLYVVQPKDRFLDIVAAHNAEFERRGLGRVTTEQVLKANPQLKDPDRLLVGQKLYIPMPSKTED